MMLHEALDTAVRERLIAKNPTNGTTIPKNNYAEKQILGDEQLDAFLEAIKGEEYWCDFFYVEVMTGLRRGEICGLKWSDIDFDANKLRVQRSVSTKKGGGIIIGETKTNTGTRNIIMPPSVAEILQKRKQTAITEWVFPAFLNPEQPIPPRNSLPKVEGDTEARRSSVDTLSRSSPHLCNPCNEGRRRCENAIGYPRSHKREFYSRYQK